MRIIALCGSPEWAKLLRNAAEDPAEEVRDEALLGLLRLGDVHPYLQRWDMVLRNYHDAHINSVGKEDYYRAFTKALAQTAQPDLISLMLRYRIPMEPKTMATLLRRAISSERSIDVLMSAPRPDDQHWSQPSLASQILAAGEGDIKPRLYAALTSANEVQHANAASALAIMGDAGAIPRLIAALQFNSNVSRVAIVWALGKLHATDAAPALSSLYMSVASRAGSTRGMTFSTQGGPRTSWRSEQIIPVSLLRRDWDNLLSGTGPNIESFLTQRPNGILTGEMILSALKEIGGQASDAFYRQLAASPDAEVRHEAATQLQGKGNEDILKRLLRDDDQGIGVAAAVSLFTIGDEAGRTALLDWTGKCDRLVYFGELHRVSDAKRLAFLKGPLEACDQTGKLRWRVDSYSIERILERKLQ